MLDLPLGLDPCLPGTGRSASVTIPHESLPRVYFPFKQQVANPKWDCTDPQYYKLVVVDKNNGNAVLRELDIAQVRLIGNSKEGVRFSRCTAPNNYPNDIDLVLNSKVTTKHCVNPQLQSWLQARWGTFGKHTRVSPRKRRRLFSDTGQHSLQEAIKTGPNEYGKRCRIAE